MRRAYFNDKKKYVKAWEDYKKTNAEEIKKAQTFMFEQLDIDPQVWSMSMDYHLSQNNTELYLLATRMMKNLK